MKKQSLSGREYVVFSPETLSAESECPLAILHGDLTMYQLLTENNLLPMKHCFAVMILSTNRLDDFSPWPASALHEKFPDFKGNANMYLKWIQQELLPKISAFFRIVEEEGASHGTGGPSVDIDTSTEHKIDTECYGNDKAASFK